MPISKKAEKLDYFQERALFKEFLQTQPGFEESEPYVWEEISDFTNAYLMNSVDPGRSKQLLDYIKSLSGEVTRLKSTYGISKSDVELLKHIGSQ